MLIPTEEQLKIANYQGDLLVVKAGAGCTKTSTLELFAKANPELRMLYLVFGKANRDDAELRFKGTNVVPRTQHAIALSRCGLDIKHKLTDNYRLTDIKQFLKLDSWGQAQEVSNLLQDFLISDKESIAELGGGQQLTALATRLWDAARDPKSPFLCKPDVYLKHYCLQPPELHTWFKVILLDEAQDTNPVISDWIMRQQQCRKILVGDDEQQLFTFRGAKNFLSDVVKHHNADRLILSKSFRFGQPIAEVANAVIRLKYRGSKDEPLKITGIEDKSTTIFATAPESWDTKPYTILHRTVSGTIETALDHEGKSLYWIGGFERYRAQDVLDVFYLAINKRELIVRKKLLTEARDIKDYRLIAERTKDVEQKRILRMLDRHFSKLPEMIKDLKRRTVTDPGKADITIGTTHASKGLEFPRVALADDFHIRRLLIEGRISAIPKEEFNLLYVAATRATEALACNDVMNFIIRQDPAAVSRITYSREGQQHVTPKVIRADDNTPRTFSTLPLSE